MERWIDKKGLVLEDMEEVLHCKDEMKKCLIIRLAAIGDAIQSTVILPLLKRDGYEVHYYGKSYSEDVLRHNPHIDKFIVHDDSIPNGQPLLDHFDKISEGYDKVVNLTGSIEGGLLAVEGRPEFDLPHDERHSRYNKNYYDRQLELAGYSDTGKKGELYFTPAERGWANDIRKKYRGKFLILWSLSGSSYHKTYPYAENVAVALLNKYPRIQTISNGDAICAFLEWDHVRNKQSSGVWPIRKSMIMTKYADLVIAPETGILNAAGCFDTPKIALLSHSSSENLTKYFENCTNLHADVSCYPCHQMHYTQTSCPLGVITTAPVCMDKLKPQALFEAVEKEYLKWEQKHGSLYNKRRTESLCA